MRFPKLGKKRGSIGIGTLIVFIAMVLVAAVAAAVLMNTSNFLQQKAYATGKQTTQQVSTGLQIDSITGYAPAANQITELAIQVSVLPGSSPIDLNQTKLYLSDGSQDVVLHYGNVKQALSGSVFSTSNTSIWHNLTGTTFGVLIVQDADGSLSGSIPTIDQGDIAILAVNASAVFGSPIGPRTPLTIKIVPELGNPAFAQVTTPSAYGLSSNDRIVTLATR
ncbi:MAG: flagellin [Thermococci archaeon]|nr:flagellin [Thermococci archaeon]